MTYRPKPGLITIHLSTRGNSMHVETQDMWLTAFLSLNGLELHQLKDYGPRKLFVFKDDETFQRLKRNYYFNEGSVDPLELKNKIRELKSMTVD